MSFYRDAIKHVQSTQGKTFRVKPTVKATNKDLAFNKVKAYYDRDGKAGKVYSASVHIPKKYQGTEMGRLMGVHELRENLESQYQHRTAKGEHRRAMKHFKGDIAFVKCRSRQ